MAPSSVCDSFGLFATKSIAKGSCIGFYAGELISEEDEKNRDPLVQLKNSSYLFWVKKGPFKIIDALIYGNKTRFINHMPLSRSNVKVMEYTGDFSKIIFLAKKDILKGQELFFDYGPQFKLKWKTE